MKGMTRLAAVAAIAAMPLAALAQSDSLPLNDSLSRAQVKSDQLNVERAGYTNSIGDHASYPREAQAAEARVGAQQVSEAESSGYGGVMPGSSASGAPGSMALPAHTGGVAGGKSVYFGQ